MLNSKWVEGYARFGFDILTYATVRSVARPPYALPNIVFVENRQHAAVALPGAASNGSSTLAVSTGTPSMDPEVWRKDVRRAKERLVRGQILMVSVAGTAPAGSDADALALDYARCATWAAEAGADAIEVHLACPGEGLGLGEMVFEDPKVAVHILSRIRAHVGRPVVAKLGAFRSPRLLHETLTQLAPWVQGFVLLHGIQRRVIDEEGRPVFEGKEREIVAVVGADTYPGCSRQVEEAVAWRKAGDWQRAILAVGGVITVERARQSLRDGADAVLVGTAALVDPLFASRLRGALQSAA